MAHWLVIFSVILFTRLRVNVGMLFLQHAKYSAVNRFHWYS